MIRKSPSGPEDDPDYRHRMLAINLLCNGTDKGDVLTSPIGS